MGNLWGLSRNISEIARFTRELAEGISGRLEDNGYNPVDFNYQELARKSGYVLTWDYGNHSNDIMITHSREDKKVYIDRFWGVKHAHQKQSTSRELRIVANIYDEVTAYLESRFGKPISQHDGRSIYSAQLEEIAQEARLG